MAARVRSRGAGRALVGTAVAVCAAVLTACGSSPDASPAASATTPPPTPAITATQTAPSVADYLPGLPAQLRLPPTAGPAPLIVMVPGGGWATADPTGLIPLAARLAAAGSTTSLITYAATESGSTFPEAVDDVACAVRWSAQEAAAQGHPATHVILLGHSAGGHLAALVAFSGQEFGADCPDPAVPVDGLIGMAGVYDTDELRPYLSEWMGIGPTQAPDTWRRANPMSWVRDGTRIPEGMRVLLLHGDADTSVPLAQTTGLADALSLAGVEVVTTVLPGLDHLALFEAPNAGPPVAAWMAQWPS